MYHDIYRSGGRAKNTCRFIIRYTICPMVIYRLQTGKHTCR
jgi:hypothetical protein